MNLPLLEKPLFYLGGHYISFLGLLAFAILFAIGLITAKTLQSDVVRRFFARFKLDTNFIAIVTTILSVSALAFFTVTAINAAGVPLLWTAPLPGVTLSLVQIFLLIALLIGVFWFSSRTKRFLFNRFLVNSGLDRALQYAIAQIVSNLVLIVGIFIVLENTGIHLGALTVFAGAVGVGIGFGLQNIASNFISGLVILAERPITIGDRVEVAGLAGQVELIRARSTVIRTNDNIAMIVPNSKFIEEPVTNWTYGDPRVRFRIPVGVAYGSDVNKVREALIAAGQSNPHVLPGSRAQRFSESIRRQLHRLRARRLEQRNERSTQPIQERSQFRDRGEIPRSRHRNPLPAARSAHSQRNSPDRERPQNNLVHRFPPPLPGLE